MVVIENYTITSLTSNDALVKAFPFLATAKQQMLKQGSGGCSSCGGRVIAGIDFNHIKMQLASMPAEAQIKFKQLTGWDSVKVIYATGAGTHTVVF